MNLMFQFFGKCYQNIIYGKINIRVPLPPIYIREPGIMEKQVLRILRKQYLTSIGIKPLKPSLWVKKLIS